MQIPQSEQFSRQIILCILLQKELEPNSSSGQIIVSGWNQIEYVNKGA